MQLKEEIKKIMFEYSDRLLNSMGDYVQCVNVEDWDNVAEQILNLLQSNDAGQPNASKPMLAAVFLQIDKWIETSEQQAEVFKSINMETAAISSNAMAQAYWNVKQLIEVNCR